MNQSNELDPQLIQADQQQVVLSKKKILEKAKCSLKKQFIGLDKIIDEVVDTVSSWYLFPDLQEKPLIVNLWGLTGVGKTALINQLSQLLDYEEQYYHFDLGDSDTREWGVKSQIEEIYENDNGYPVLIALDEFQHARTINEDGKEVTQRTARILWQLLDSGKFQIARSSYQVGEIFDLSIKLRYFLRNGVTVARGIVISQQAFFTAGMNKNDSEHKLEKEESKQADHSEPVLFVPENFHDTVYALVKDKYASPFELKAKLMDMDGYETLYFLNTAVMHGNSPKTVDCSKSLIFVMGNLDEAYTMSDDFNPDIDADEFHEQSKKITIPEIKKALQTRFRNEQIARLGNIHIIYPAFSHKSFRKIINLELGRISKNIQAMHGVKLKFSTSLQNLIYREGVYPTQGARPIFTTIHQIINTKLGHIISELYIQKIVPDNIKLSAKKNRLLVEYITHGKPTHSIDDKILLNLEKLRENKQDDVQAITAVHESGHAILSVMLLNTIPEIIYSRTVEVNTAGFVFTKFKWKYIAKQEITARLAMMLGGLTAEKVIFGEDRITSGAQSDIQKATQFISAMIKECGMGELAASFQNKSPDTNNFVYDQNNALNQSIKQWLIAATELAEKTLKQQQTLLLKMADYLSDNRSIDAKLMAKMLQKYAADFDQDTIIKDGDHLFYREHLKQKVAQLK